MYYTELLPRLNTLSVVLDFDGDSKDITSISIDQDVLVVSTNTNCLRIKLALNRNQDVAKMAISSLKCSGGALQISLTFPPGEVTEHTQSFMDFNRSDTQKWSCSDLQKTPQNKAKQNIFHFSCTYCNEPLIDSTKSRFFDMPSELWSEMMDFWHCHKPHDHGHGHGHASHKYEELKPEDLAVIIGSHYFLVDKAGSLQTNGARIECPKCHSELGGLEASGSKKIFKYNLALNYGSTVEHYPPHLLIYNSLLDKINLSASRIFVIKDKSRSLFVWVLNIGLGVSTRNGVFRNALKLLYSYEEGKGESAEEMSVPLMVFDDCVSSLEEFNLLLPMNYRLATVMEKQLHVGFMAGAD